MDNPEDRRDGRSVHGHVRDIFDAHGELAHVAGGQRDDDEVGGGRIAQVIVEIAGESDHAIAGRPGIGSGLTRRLVHAFANRLIALAAEVPVINLVGDIAADRLAHIKEGDAVFIGRQEAIVGLGEHGSEAQGVAVVGVVDDKFVGAAGQGDARAFTANRHSRHAGVCLVMVG